MKINWFSPLPPAITDVADYTAWILPALKEHAEVVLWTDQTEWDSNLEKIGPVRYYDIDQVPWDGLNEGDLSFFNIGDNPLFHSTMWQVSRRHSGIVILHDLSLQHLFLGIYKEYLKDRNGYLEEVAFYYGQQGRECATRVWDSRLIPDDVMEGFPLTTLALEQARGVIVHTRKAFQDLKDQNRWPVCYVPLPYASSHSAAGDAPLSSKLEARGQVSVFPKNHEESVEREEAGGRIPDEYHDPADYGQAIFRFAKEVGRLHYPAMADYLMNRCAAEMSLWSKTAVLENIMRRAAQEITELCAGPLRHSPDT